MTAKNTILWCLLLLLVAPRLFAQTYNAMWVPDTLSGTNFNLAVKDTFAQFVAGNQTITTGINKSRFWGPTLIMTKGTTVHLNVTNNLKDTTTLHWHGMHTPAVMDGGPYQTIPPGTVWQPYWKVQNQAATLWYHPHLHKMTQAQMTKGMGGFIIVRDAAEAALALPRKYGIDDFPLALASRRFLSSNQLAATLTDNYGDQMMVNGTLSPQLSLPRQVVRLRILNADVQRGYNLGFSDNRTFYVIGNDGGLLGAPVAVTRLAVHTGERYEILVDLTGSTVGSSLFLKSYNSTAELLAILPGTATGNDAFGWPGQEGRPSTPNGSSGPLNGSLLNNVDFNVLRINVAAATATAKTTIPTKLITNAYWSAANVTASRTIAVTGGQRGTAFSLGNQYYSSKVINQTVNLNALEKWTITNNAIFGHAFHLHDVSFNIISRSGGTQGTTIRSYEQGWKDVVWLPINGTVTFLAKFEDYADPSWPYMYHCHALTHEDEGMMGTFKVLGTAAAVAAATSATAGFSLYPNPTQDRLNIAFATPGASAYYVRVTDAVGRTIYMLPRPQLQDGIDVSQFLQGLYYVQLTDEKTRVTTTQKFVKE